MTLFIRKNETLFPQKSLNSIIMKRIMSLLSAGILLSNISLLAQTQKLRCEYLENPLGIDQTLPRFTL